MEESPFEKAGLKIDQERILTYSKLSCPFDCRYCFVDDLSEQQQEGVSYLSENQLDLLAQLPEKISLIMLGCDTEFFQSKDNAIGILEKLSGLGKDLSVVTKIPLSEKYIEKLGQINSNLRRNGNLLSLSISIPCLESAKLWEPKAPNPQKRIKTIESASRQGIATFVAIRPLLPSIPTEELRTIVTATSGHCLGYYSGPLYLKDLETDLIHPDVINDLKIEKINPHWMPNGNMFYRIEKPGQMDELRAIIEGQGKILFDGAAEATRWAKERL
jgi:hypothetical protein